MDLNRGLDDLVAVALVAALAPLVIAALPGPRIPQVVIFLIGGVLIGPHVLGLAETSNIQLLSNIGLGFLFLLAGYELDLLLLRQRPGKLAILGCLISAAIAVGVVAGLAAAGYIKDYVPVGLALTTTALGTLLPILRDNDMLVGQLGRDVYAAGAVRGTLPHPDHRGFPHPARPFRRARLGGCGRDARHRPVSRTVAGQEQRPRAGRLAS
jgi:Kef-type K+ transport system membrane component KefB